MIQTIIKNKPTRLFLILGGFFMGMIIVPATIIAYLALWIAKKKLVTSVPRWLIIANIFFLLVFIGYIIYNNFIHSSYDTYYN